MHKPTIEKTSITILKPEPQDMSAYRNLFGKSNDVDLRESYKIVKPTRLNLTLIGTVFKEKGALAIIENANRKSKVYQKNTLNTSCVQI
jgi:hypothetical protein